VSFSLRSKATEECCAFFWEASLRESSRVKETLLKDQKKRGCKITPS